MVDACVLELPYMLEYKVRLLLRHPNYLQKRQVPYTALAKSRLLQGHDLNYFVSNNKALVGEDTLTRPDSLMTLGALEITPGNR